MTAKIQILFSQLKLQYYQIFFGLFILEDPNKDNKFHRAQSSTMCQLIPRFIHGIIKACTSGGFHGTETERERSYLRSENPRKLQARKAKDRDVSLDQTEIA